MGKVWRETGGEKEYLRRKEEERLNRISIEAGLERCPVCGGRARVAIFGMEKRGVWVGCDASERCMRNIEWHSEGWSMKEVAEEWNRRNRGWRRGVRKLKMWLEREFGAEKRYERKIRREAEKERRERGAEITARYVDVGKGRTRKVIRKLRLALRRIREKVKGLILLFGVGEKSRGRK